MKRAIFLLLMCAALAPSLSAAPKSELWAYWQQNGTTHGIDHSSWQAFLDVYLTTHQSGPNRVRYADVTATNAQKLNQYIEYLSGLPIRAYTKNEQFAYWVNLYNAKTVALVLDNYPVESIAKIKPSFFSFGPWDKKVLVVEGQSLTLNDIEHRILRPIWQDERIHYVVNCASISCPNLPAQAVPIEDLEAFLDAAAEMYINDKRAVRLADGELILSSIYKWYAVDFGDQDDLAKHLAFYHATLDMEVIRQKMRDVSYEYNWQLNDSL